MCPLLRITAPICFLSLALMSSVARRLRISSTSRTRVTRPLDLQVSQLDGIPVGISSGAAIWTAIQLAKRPENKGKMIVAIVASAAERYLSSWLFADINVESDSVEDLFVAAK